jgi:hypothetical protein
MAHFGGSDQAERIARQPAMPATRGAPRGAKVGYWGWPPDETFVTYGLARDECLQLAGVGVVYDGAGLARLPQ